MTAELPPFSQLHIDVARFATDDFNPFHDPGKWHRLRDNPFGSPIVLGFQTATWLAEQVEIHRREHDDPGLLAQLPVCHWQLNFAAAIKPGQSCRLTIRPGRYDETKGVLSNRVLLKHGRHPLLLGQHGRCRQLAEDGEDVPSALAARPDRSELEGGWFLKRKFMMTANAKNFLLGCQVPPQRYFDELEDRVRFPYMFPVSYVSCALLERARCRGHDFEAEPMVYARHEIQIDLQVAETLRSNARLHILVRPEREDDAGQHFQCRGLIDDTPLFRADIVLVPLARIVAALQRR
ncbi:hypothetical protein MIN45_P0004 [Methylomarinovum tepidoasis]|uniref:MaoC-like domain-containing protein n=1 Tax=Methylomarinovum tepidoasis TaxID=2840183 RepID=A0AAU9CJ46_9GAMM|nr:hypothetical protein [Methylomarinovum sp. IN45]BCX87637.1 hypothetical protein MIN45_P0004 [Methylomarinovum sp. IN45]